MRARGCARQWTGWRMVEQPRRLRTQLTTDDITAAEATATWRQRPTPHAPLKLRDARHVRQANGRRGRVGRGLARDRARLERRDGDGCPAAHDLRHILGGTVCASRHCTLNDARGIAQSAPWRTWCSSTVLPPPLGPTMSTRSRCRVAGRSASSAPTPTAPCRRESTTYATSSAATSSTTSASATTPTVAAAAIAVDAGAGKQPEGKRQQ